MESRCARACARTSKKLHNALEEAHKSFGFSYMKSLTIMVSRYREGCQKLFRDCLRQIIWFVLRAIGHRFRHKLRTIWMLSFWKCVDFSRCVNVNDVSQIEIRNNHRSNGAWNRRLFSIVTSVLIISWFLFLFFCLSSHFLSSVSTPT